MNDLMSKLEKGLEQPATPPKNILELQLAQEIPALLNLSIKALETMLTIGGVEVKLKAAALILRSATTLAKIKP